MTGFLLKIVQKIDFVNTKSQNNRTLEDIIVYAVLKYPEWEEMYYADRYHRTRHEKRIDGTVLYRLLRHSQ